MEPITWAILTTLALLAGGGLTQAARQRRAAQERVQLRAALRAPHPVGATRVSVFDVYWDLGASSWSLELMAHHDLLPEHEEEIFGVWHRLEDLVAGHGSYDAFLEDSLEAIGEFFDEHRHVGSRRQLPGLSQRRRRVLELEGPESAEVADNLPVRRHEGSGVPTHQEARRRRALRGDTRSGYGGPVTLGLSERGGGGLFDVEKLGNLDAQSVLGAFISGDLGRRLEQWWMMRRVRQLRDALDQELIAFYTFYVEAVRRSPHFYEPLYDASRRWREEATRLRFDRKRRDWRGEEWGLAADVLSEDAISLATSLSERAYQNTHATIETLHGHAAAGNTAMAGYLVYLNAHAFFAGRHPDYGDHLRRVDFATHRLQTELRRLRDQGLL
ncbi:hypothetical protein DL240_00310 [Lujinxingia litoralis]|uniref:Uncharacterized protein n=1 Tax=Lujinxingia litoralis TaxID=2211119 RepID=A0A328C7Y3_9DELT|nr:hypothetical protein [Lujinxingia litoralis]RAL24687.1 hypothetical protein DL240_00310 [Lujinxingia litoralis]